MSDKTRELEPSDAPTEIHVRPDGSYKVYGPVVIRDVDGIAYDLAPHRKQDSRGERIKLCRCGASKTMPFCDESHAESGFRSCPRVDDASGSDEST